MGSDVSTSSSEVKPVQLPNGYEVLKVLGEGCFGQVLKCWRKDIEQTVAVKIPKYFEEGTINEVSMLRRFKRLKLDQHNIVEFIDCFQTKHGKAIVFEALDISLGDYLETTSFAPMRLSDIGTVIQQMAKAFEALKGIGVIHGDLHLYNIMMENHQTRPFRVKLIDFGGAISRSEARQGALLQPLAFRSPEILLGCPFSEAIDMWSLGCLLFIMVCGKQPFQGRSEYALLQSIIDILGQPADHLLNAGIKTKNLFKKTDSNSWELKTSFEYFRCHLNRVNKDHKLQSLDDLKEMRLEENNEAEAAEREQCVELLKAMLKMDADERITPREVLTHPFITKDYHYPNNGALAAASPPRKTEQSKTNLKKMMRPKKSVLSPKRRPAFTTKWPPSTLTWVHPAAAEGTQPAATPLKYDESVDIKPDDCTPSPTFLPSGVILVRPATAENTLMLEGQGSKVSGRTYIVKISGSSAFTSLIEDFDCEPAAPLLTDDDVINVRPDDCTPTPTILPSGVILVRPATAERTLLEDQESAVSFQSGLKETSGSSVTNTERSMKSSVCEDSGSCENTGAKKKRQKKNRFSRIFSWMRKTFGSCCTCDEED